ncbi:hypothetical protein AB5J56_01765 [Streptomyces sp. R21]|uniref:Uncharacterized protein n=1 Tax=Streptomyces sp. R21 TaxID=3238627 RepID=A0AB39P092_9ACTN
MTIPGFRAEAAVQPSSGAYRIHGRPRSALADRIAPMFTQEELDLINACERSYQICEEGCDQLKDNYDAWQPCNADCLQSWTICMNP